MLDVRCYFHFISQALVISRNPFKINLTFNPFDGNLPFHELINYFALELALNT